jgi:hypothetical protein
MFGAIEFAGWTLPAAPVTHRGNGRWYASKERDDQKQLHVVEEAHRKALETEAEMKLKHASRP